MVQSLSLTTATYANLLGQKGNLHRKRVQIPKRWLGPLTWGKGLGVGTFPLSALFYNYSVWGRVNLVPRTHRITVTWKVYPKIISYPDISKYFMAEQVQLHSRIWVRDWDKDNIWTLTIENYSTTRAPTKHSYEWHHNLFCPRSLLFHCCVQILHQKIGKIKNILIISKLHPWIIAIW